MAARHSSLCAPLGFLLLLIGVISYHLPEVQAGPTNFWCNYNARKNNEEKIEDLQKRMVGCVGSDTLPSPSLVRLCVGINEEWRHKTPQQKRAEVAGDMQMVQGGVQWAWNQSTLQCQKDLLKHLGHRIENDLAIVNKLEIQNDMVTPTPAAGQICNNQNNLTKVMTDYRNLLKGKLHQLAIDLKHIICNKANGTSIT